jgi:DNA-binding FrmR family transcriptional regulator
MAHTIRDKAKLLARIRRIQGQASALEKALDQGVDCAAILQQTAAIRGAVNGLMAVVMEGHLVEHLVREPQAKRRRHDVTAVLNVIRAYLK